MNFWNTVLTYNKYKLLIVYLNLINKNIKKYKNNKNLNIKFILYTISFNIILLN